MCILFTIGRGLGTGPAGVGTAREKTSISNQAHRHTDLDQHGR